MEWKCPSQEMQFILKERKPDPSKTRREETTLTQLCISHTKLTHYFILKQELPPKYSCGKPCTVEHILMECRNLIHTWRGFYNIKTMKDLFETSDLNIINFLKKNKTPSNQGYWFINVTCKKIHIHTYTIEYTSLQQKTTELLELYPITNIK